MPTLVIHPQTNLQLERLLTHPSHAVLIVGPDGSGKDTLVRQLSCGLLGLASADELSNYPYLYTVEPEKDKTSISIEAIRELQHFTKLKLPNNDISGPMIRRIVQIRHADEMTTEAQNALLKLLEEPPSDTMLVLTAASEQQLLPTIRSRTQVLQVQRPSRDEVTAFFTAAGHDSQSIVQAFRMSGGLPGLMHALLSDSDHPLKDSVILARQLLQMSQFERLTHVEAIAKNKQTALQLTFVLQQMARAAIDQSAAKAAETGVRPDAAIKQWHKIQRAAYDAEQGYAVSAQAKLVLTHLMLSL